MSRRIAAAVTAIVLGASLAGCSGSSNPTHPSTSAAAHTTTPLVTRWWSDSGHRAGSAIGTGTVALRRSREDYCGMLRATIAAKRSILPGAGAHDPKLAAATTAFVGEVEQVAPPALANAWKTVGDAVLALVHSGGSLAKVKGVDAAAVGAAVQTIASDAKFSCGVRLGA